VRSSLHARGGFKGAKLRKGEGCKSLAKGRKDGGTRRPPEPGNEGHARKASRVDAGDCQDAEGSRRRSLKGEKGGRDVWPGVETESRIVSTARMWG